MPPLRQTVEEFLNESKIVNSPNIKVIEPSNVSLESFTGEGDIKLIEPETEEEKLSFAQRFGDDLRKRASIAEEITDAVSSGEQSFAEGILQIAGKVGVGGVFDLIGEGIVSGFRALPDFVEKPIRNAATSFLETEVGKSGLNAVQSGSEVYKEWKSNNPRAARNLESIVDIGLLLFPVKAKAPAKPTIAGKLGEGAIVSGEEARALSKEKFIKDLISPQKTTAVRESEVARTIETGGLLKQKEVLPSISEKGIAEEVSKITEISQSKTLQGNFNIINKNVSELAKKLESDIKAKDFVYPRQRLLAELDGAKVRLSENPLIVGDAERVAEKLLEGFKRFINEEPGKGSGILSARKKFDNWIKQQKGTNVFDPKNENALTTAIREVRQTANKFLIENAKNVDVEESLLRQTRLFRALDNLTPKAANEASNAVLRAWQRMSQVLSVKSGIVQSMALLAGVGGLGAAAVFAPFVRNLLFSLGLIYGARQVVLSPQTRIFLGKLLQGIDVAIRKTKDADLINQLRADRAMVLEILDLSSEKIEEEPQEKKN